MSTTRFVLVAFCIVSALDAVAVAADRSSTRPNILVAIADDWSFGHGGSYGCAWVETPGLDRIAREGLLFRRAYTPNAKCAPSRACLLTGRNSWQLEEACNHWAFFPPHYKTYAEALAEHGYTVGKTGKAWGPGFASDAEGRPRKMAGRGVDQQKQKPPAKGISNNNYTANFSDFLESVESEKPWCFWYGAFEPHRGYQRGVGVQLAGKRLEQIERVPAYWPDNETVRNDMLDYAFEVEHFDAHLVRMLELLAQRGELANTLIVVTSDHGMPFPRCKGQAYEHSNHVPLAIRWPEGIKAPGRTIDDYVSLIDLAPTFLEVCGLEEKRSGMQPITGRSLTNLFQSSESGTLDPARDHVLIGKERHDVGRPQDRGYPIRGIVQDEMLYLYNFETSRWPAGNPETGYLNCDGSPTKSLILEQRSDQFWKWCFGKRATEELYDLRKDPDCVVNLAQDADYRSRAVKLKEQLFARLLAQQDPRMRDQGEVFDNYVYADKRTRNFYERYQAGEKVPAGWVNRTDFDKRKDTTE